MDKKLKTKWVKALRSGRYKQAEGLLYSPEAQGFCCLGVLCKVAGAKLNELEDMGWPNNTTRFKRVIDGRIGRKLGSLNDAGVPFEMIAGLIQETL